MSARRNRSPAFQFYPGEWLSSTKVAMMSLAEQGAYLRLLCHEWADPHCTLPGDEEQLAVLSGLGEGWFKGGSTKIRACFRSHPKRTGRIYNVRLRLEKKKQNAWRRKSREGGISSGESRRNRPKGGSQMVEPTANQKATLQSSSSDLRSTSPLPSGDPPRKKSRTEFKPPTPDEVRAWAEDQHPEYLQLVSPEKFCAHYEGNGWRVGRNPMKSWQATFVKWALEELEQRGSTSAPRASGFKNARRSSPRPLEQVQQFDLESRAAGAAMIAGEASRAPRDE